MSQIKWITPAGSLGTQVEEEYIAIPLEAQNTTGSPLTFKVIAGSLAEGLQLTRDGVIQGVPVIDTIANIGTNFEQTFTVRATSVYGNISDRTFSIVINSISLPQITPKTIPETSLGSYYDGYYIDIQLVATDPNPYAPLAWEQTAGELPPGLTLTAKGRLYGHIKPYHNPASDAILGWGMSGWDYIPLDAPTASDQSRSYHFTAQVYDGTNYDQAKYIINVQAKSLFTTDNVELDVDTDTITVDTDAYQEPYIITLPQDLPDQRQDSNFAFQVVGEDIEDAVLTYKLVLAQEATFDQSPSPDQPWQPVVGFDEVSFDQEDHSLPDGLWLDEDTGWIVGHLDTQFEERKSYHFGVFCYKEVLVQVENPLNSGNWESTTTRYNSEPVYFDLVVLGSMDNYVTWITPANLGTIDNGSISELYVAGISSKGKTLNYRLKEAIKTPDNIPPSEEVILYTPQARSKLPQGLELLPNGLIIGRPTFEHFTLDGGSTTFDKKKMDFDNVYVFTVTASDEVDPTTFDNQETLFDNDGSLSFDYAITSTISSDLECTIRINNYNITPYENIYLRALPNRDQRVEFQSIIDDTSIFPPELIFRAEDPWFGKATDIKFLFAAGLAPSLAQTYVDSMSQHHYNKVINLGNVKTAIALDENFNIKYEVVYIDVLDRDAGAASSLDRTMQVKPQYNTLPYTPVYSNSLDNMQTEVSGVGYANRGALPVWMVNPQSDGRVLGFTRGIVLAYTVPGAAALVAYRLQQKHTSFNELDFTADRYQLDHFLSQYYDIPNKEFIPSTEATFDRLPPVGGLHPYAGAVDFAVVVPFDEINARTIEYINRAGGLDGVLTIQTGQRIIFAKQEQFNTAALPEFATTKDPFDSGNFDGSGFNLSIVPKQYTSPNDGWNVDNGIWGSTGYGTLSFAPMTVVPGYTEKLMSGMTNERGGIWEVTVSEDQVVTLVFIKEIELNEYVQVGGGQSYGQTKLFYDPVVPSGYTVPAYHLLTAHLSPSNETTRFDSGATRFYNNRDMYAVPETNDAWIKFPKYNVYG